MDEYIYIGNYLKLSQIEKEKFLNFITVKFNMNSVNQKLIFSEESMIMSFFKDVDIITAYESVNKYFKDFSEIKIDIANKEKKQNKKRLLFTYANKSINI